MKDNKQYSFEQFEANLLFRISMFVSYSIERLEKKIYESSDNLTSYIDKRKRIVQKIEEFEKEIKEILND